MTSSRRTNPARTLVVEHLTVAREPGGFGYSLGTLGLTVLTEDGEARTITQATPDGRVQVLTTGAGEVTVTAQGAQVLSDYVVQLDRRTPTGVVLAVVQAALLHR